MGLQTSQPCAGCFYSPNALFCESRWSQHAFNDKYEPDIGGQAEIGNTVSNSFYCIFGVIAFLVSRKADPVVKLQSIFLFYTGVGSALYHATGWYGMGVLDGLPMLFTVLVAPLALFDFLMVKLDRVLTHHLRCDIEQQIQKEVSLERIRRLQDQMSGKHSRLAQALSLLVYLIVSAFFFFYIQQTVVYDSIIDSAYLFIGAVGSSLVCIIVFVCTDGYILDALRFMFVWLPTNYNKAPRCAFDDKFNCLLNMYLEEERRIAHEDHSEPDDHIHPCPACCHCDQRCFQKGGCLHSTFLSLDTTRERAKLYRDLLRLSLAIPFALLLMAVAFFNQYLDANDCLGDQGRPYWGGHIIWHSLSAYSALVLVATVSYARAALSGKLPVFASSKGWSKWFWRIFPFVEWHNDPDRALSAQQLIFRASMLATELQQVHKIVAGSPVAHCAERPIEIIIGRAAITLVGGACRPIDANQPIERVLAELRAARPMVLVTTADMRDRLLRCSAEKIGVPVLVMDSVLRRSALPKRGYLASTPTAANAVVAVSEPKSVEAEEKKMEQRWAVAVAQSLAECEMPAASAAAGNSAQVTPMPLVTRISEPDLPLAAS